MSTGVVTMFDSYREMRHQTAYSTDFEATKEEAKEAVKDAVSFIKELERIL